MFKSCREIINNIEEKYPLSLAESYDNIGLIIGDPKAAITKILVCLDINDEIINEAIENNINMIVSHHPLIFSPIKHLLYNEYKAALIAKIIKHDICIYALHTNFDNAEDGMNDILALALGLNSINKLGNSTGRYGILESDMLLVEFCDFVKVKLNINSLRVTGNLNSLIKRVAVVGGAGCAFINSAVALNCDVMITGDVKHHDAIDSLDSGICIIDASHFSTEVFSLPYIVDFISNVTGIETITTKVNTNPFHIV
jgi:GTP cyclohydrolase I